MADLEFVWFCINGCLVRKENQFRLTDDFSNIDFTIFSRYGRAILRLVFPRFFTTQMYRSDPQNVLHNEGEARNFNIALFRGRNRRLLAAVMCKSRLLALEKVVNMHVL